MRFLSWFTGQSEESLVYGSHPPLEVKVDSFLRVFLRDEITPEIHCSDFAIDLG